MYRAEVLRDGEHTEGKVFFSVLVELSPNTNVLMPRVLRSHDLHLS